MIIEVNDAGEVLLPAGLVQAAPHTRLEAEREGDAVVLKPIAEERSRKCLLDDLPVWRVGLSIPRSPSDAKTCTAMTAGSAVFVDANVLIY